MYKTPRIRVLSSLPPPSRTDSVQEALAGLLPAARRAPLLPVLDAVHLPALLGFTTKLPADRHTGQCGSYRRLCAALMYRQYTDRPAGGAVLLQPLLSHAD